MTPAAWREAFIAQVMAAPSASLAAFREGLAAEGASALHPVLCPMVIDLAFHGRIEAAVREWHLGMHTVLASWADDQLEPIAVPAELRSRVVNEARERRALGSTRYDFIVKDDGELALIECQAGDPSGMGVEEASAGAFARLGVEGVQRSSVASSMRRFVAEHPSRAGLVVFVIHREAFLEWDVARLVKVFRAEGVEAVMADPSELSFRDGRLWLGARTVDTVVRDSLEDLLAPERVEASRAFLAAWVNDAVRVVNPAGSIVADHKVLLGRLKTRGVPETRAPGDELPERARWVLKPSDGFGGFDVTIGPAVSDAQWAEAIVAARRSGRTFLLQSFLRAETHALPVPRGDSLELRRHHVVYSGWMHGDRFGGLFARVHEKPVVNVHQGGGLVPVYTVE
ncbi:MAG: circularly permuted type 2 ATP-grasp protein [Archangiaceae bacterium]|nr:circularly permuted type 2 ATP-grasp protein [Archangiaceae bacterium]